MVVAKTQTKAEAESYKILDSFSASCALWRRLFLTQAFTYALAKRQPLSLLRTRREATQQKKRK